MPEIGRFFNVDPIAEKYVYNSPYAFSENHVVAHREFEGLEKVSIQQTLGNNYLFYRAYNIQRQTTGGQQVSKLIAGQTKMNVFYFVYSGGYTSAMTSRVADMEAFRKQKESDPEMKGLSDKEIEQAMDGKELLLIGINQSEMDEDTWEDNAFSLNHEEVAHAKNHLKGTFMSSEDDHANYYGSNWRSTISPDNSAVKSSSRFKDGVANNNCSRSVR